jgi:hypothetical protein
MAFLVVSSLSGWVPSMNNSRTVFFENGPGRMPLNASTSASWMPPGRAKSRTGHFRVACSMKFSQT